MHASTMTATTTQTATSDQQAKTLDRFIKGWQRWQSADDMLGLFSEDFQQRTLPLALGIPPRQKKDSEFVLTKLVEAISNFRLDVIHIVHDIARGKASLFAIATGDTPFGDFANEFSVYITFDESGQQITRLDEYMDSAFLMKFFPSFKKWMAEQDGEKLKQEVQKDHATIEQIDAAT